MTKDSTEVSDLKDEIAELKARIAELEEEVDTLRGDIHPISCNPTQGESQ